MNTLKLVKQNRPGSCNIACVQMILNYYDIDATETEIIEGLQPHEWGNLLTEIGIFLEKKSIKSKLIGNGTHTAICDPQSDFIQTLTQFEKIGSFTNQIITIDMLPLRPFIVSLDRPALHNRIGNRGPHYVVCIKQEDTILVFDPKEDAPFEVTFEHLFYASMISRLPCEDYNWQSREFNGVWLLC